MRKADVFCPKCDGFVVEVKPETPGYKTITRVCPNPNCRAGITITYGNGRLEIETRK